MFKHDTTRHEHSSETDLGADPSSRKLHQATVHELEQDRATVRVLVIEDSPTQIEQIRIMLAADPAAHYELSMAERLDAGLALLADEGFDAVLLDLTLPDSSGIDSCARVRETAAELPIVVLTGVDDEQLAIATLQVGAEDYLLKSEINSHLLVRALRYAIERKRAGVELQKAHDEMEDRVQQRTAELKQLQEVASLRQEELAHAARVHTLGQMATELAHELNQPLMAIIGFTDHCLYKMREGSADFEQCIEILEDSAKEAKRAGEIIKRMRRLVTKRVSNRTLTDVNQAVSEAVQLIQPGLDVTIQLDLDDTLSPIRIDRTQIQYVILNLARNAMQAMDNTTPDSRGLTIRTGEIEDMLFVEVADTGPGLAPEDIDRLFDPFFARREDGLGLGLAISRTIVEAHRGKLTVRQNENKGLTFRFVLPTQDQSEQ